jgi:hypothetical protein
MTAAAAPRHFEKPGINSIRGSGGAYRYASDRPMTTTSEQASDGEVHLTISFDKYLVLQEFGYNSDTPRLVSLLKSRSYEWLNGLVEEAADAG